MNIIYEAGRIPQAQVFETMQTFVTAAELDQIIEAFAGRGWMTRREQDRSGLTELELTEVGKEGPRTIFTLQYVVRKRVMQGICETEYMTVVRVLEKIVNNLDFAQG